MGDPHLRCTAISIFIIDAGSSLLQVEKTLAVICKAYSTVNVPANSEYLQSCTPDNQEDRRGRLSDSTDNPSV